MIPFYPPADETTVQSKLTSLFDAESLVDLFTDTCDTKKDITDQIPLWVVFEKDALEDEGKNPITIFDLIQKYYDWLYCDSESGSQYELGLKLLELIDIDKTREIYVGRLAGIYANGLSQSDLVGYGGKIPVDNARNFIHSVRKNFHQKKTTIDGIRYFFKTLFNISEDNVKIEFPKKYLLRLNGGRFFNENFSFPGGTGSYDVLNTLSGSCLNFSRMQDGNFYQDYSYLLKVGMKSSYYKDLYKTLTHPAGLKVIYEKTLEDYTGPQTDYDVSQVCERTFLRNYAPYGISHEYTDVIDTYQGNTYYGLNYCIGCCGTSFGIFTAPTFAFPNWTKTNITGFNFKEIPLSYFFDLCYEDTEVSSPNAGLTCTTCIVPFTTQYDIVFKYLINRYEPGWSAATESAGKAATLSLLGISAAANPFTTGGAVMNAFQYVAYPGTSGASAGWFDPIVHPRTYATAVRTAYRPFERAKNPRKANQKFINLHYNLSSDVYYDQGGPSNTFFGLGPKFRWTSMFDDPERPYSKILSLNLESNYKNAVERIFIHSPYGTLSTPQTIGGYLPNTNDAAVRAFPWLSRNYAGALFRFDQYLMLSDRTTLRDMLNDPDNTHRDPNAGIIINGVTDAHLNTQYSGLTYQMGYLGIFAGYTRGVGYTQEVSIGSPWIPYPDGITWSGGWFGSNVTLNFNERTMVMNNGSKFSITPPNLVGDFHVTNIPSGWWQSLSSNTQGLSYTFGRRLINDLNLLGDQWATKIEFIAYLGNLPYAYGEDFTMPLALYKDPSIPANIAYTKWRMDAAISQWKNKFKSPHDGFAHIFFEGSLVPRTFHMYQGPGYTAWRNITPSGISYVESIPVSWMKDQYNYTRGNSGPDSSNGAIVGVETWAHYMFTDEFGASPGGQHATEQSRYPGDTKPRHWCLDDNIAAGLQTRMYDMVLGQRKNGFTYSDSIWKSGVCGTSELGEILCDETPIFARQALDGYPFYYGSFIEYKDGALQYKRLSGTYFDVNGGVPWDYDRRFRLFYHYPAVLALNMTILDHLHSGPAYFAPPYSTPMSGWYDRTLGLTYTMGMENNIAPYDPTIYAARNSIWVASLAPTDTSVDPTDISAEDLGDVNTYEYVKPAVHVFDCAGDGGYENSTAAHFISGSNGCFDRFPSIVSKLMEIPAGKRMYYLRRYSEGPIYNEIGDRFANGKQSPWADKAGITLTNDWTSVATALANQGAEPDYISLDCEQSGLIFNSQYKGDGVGGAVTPVSSDWTAQVFGITSDANYNLVWKGATSFSSLVTDNGNYLFGITHIVNGAYHPQTDKNYLYWNRAVKSLESALLKTTITNTATSIFGSQVSVSNYNDMIIHPGTTGEVYNENGHPFMQEILAGDASSPVLYGGWNFPDSYGILQSDTTRIVRKDYADTIPFGDNAWNQLLLIIQKLRAARRNTTGRIRPYIASRYYTSYPYITHWNASSTNLGLYNEMIRHCCLTGIESFILFNDQDESSNRDLGLSSMNQVLSDVNNRLGGSISQTADASRIDFTKQVLISGAPTIGGSKLWRVTPKPSVIIRDSNNSILQMDSDGGIWMTTSLNEKLVATNTNSGIMISVEAIDYYPVVSNTPFENRRSPLTPPQNYWAGTPNSSEFELLYACMKGGLTMGLESLGFEDLFKYLFARGATGFVED